MSLNQKILKSAEYIGCEKELNKFEQVINTINGCQTKNVVICGDINSGKTTLLNKLVGEEIKKPTTVSQDDFSLAVQAGSVNVKAGFENKFINSAKMKEFNTAFFEMPYKNVLNSKNELSFDAMEMDLMVYAIPATMPFSGADIRVLEAASNKLPVIIYVSKTDIITDEETLKEVKDYVTNTAKRKFESTVVNVLFGGDDGTVDDIYSVIGEIDLEELHSLRAAYIERDAADFVKTRMQEKLVEIENEKKAREAQNDNIDDENREIQLKWDKLRVEILEICKRNTDKIDAMIVKCRAETKNKLVNELDQASNKKEWLENSLPNTIRSEIDKTTMKINDYMNNLIDLDIDWLILEVNKRFKVKLDVERFKVLLKNAPVKNPDIESADDDGNFDMKVAAGAAAVAAGVWISPLGTISTAAIALPAILVTLYSLKTGKDKLEAYKDVTVSRVKEYCDGCFDELITSVNSQVKLAYDRIITNVIKYSKNDIKAHIDFVDLYEKEETIKQMINELF